MDVVNTKMAEIGGSRNLSETVIIFAIRCNADH